MKFCSECGTILKLDRKKKLLVCPKCKRSEPTGVDLVYSKKEEETDNVLLKNKQTDNEENKTIDKEKKQHIDIDPQDYILY